jgi:hypothetical protein
MDEIIEKLGDTTVTTRNVSTTPAIDANWLGAVFAPSDARDDAQQEAAGSVLKAVSAGELTPIATRVMGLIDSYRRTLELTEIEERLQALETANA